MYLLLIIQSIRDLGATTKALGGAGKATGGLTGGVGNLSGSLDALKAKSGAAPGPLGDLQAAVENATNPFAALKDKQLEFADSISTGLSPAAATARMIIDSIKGFFASIAPVIQPVIGIIQGFVSTVTTGFQEGGIGGAINAVATALAGISPAFALVKGAVDAALPPIQSIVTTVFGIVAGFIQTNGADIVSFVQTTWNSIQGVINTILPPIQAVVSTVFGAIATFLTENSGSIQNVLTLAWNTIKTVIDGVMLVINSIIVPGFTTIATFISTHGTEIQGIIQGAWNIIKSIVETVLGVIQGVVNTFMALIKGDWQGAWDAVKGIVSTVWDGIKGIIDGALTLIQSALSLAWDAIKGTAQLGWDAVKSVVSTVWDGIKLVVDTVLGTIADALSGAWTTIKDAAAIAWGAIKDALIAPFQSAYDTISGMVQGFIDIGTAIIDGITGAIWGGGGKVAAALVGVVDNAKNEAKASAEIQSPSRVFAREIGAQVPAGIALGIDEATPDVTRSIRQTMHHLIEAAKTPTLSTPALMALPATAGASAAQGGGSNVYHITIPVDARGASNPAEVEAAAIRGAKKLIAELEAKINILQYKRG
jgi:phage-related protein